MTQFLFSEIEKFQIVPVEDRLDPVFWIERLVIVDVLAPGTVPRRDVSFRRGLNIICTEVRTPDETKPIGHNVGKTLLTRLIRYLLGERYYANETTRKSIGERLEEGYVIGQIHVKGESWIIARPISTDKSCSFALRGDLWEDALDESITRLKYEDFIHVLSNATVAHFPDIVLYQSGHSIRWIDLLSWLTRDQKCSFGSLHQWRNTKTESGTAELKSEDGVTIIRAIMDLLTVKENDLRVQHNKLLDQRKEIQDKSVQLQVDNQAINNHLLSLIDQIQTAPGQLFLDQIKGTLEDKRKGLMEIQQEYEDNVDFTDKETALLQAERDLASVETEMKPLNDGIELLEKDIKFTEESSASDYYAAVDNHPCELENCPRRPENRASISPDPDRENRLAQMKADLKKKKDILVGLSAHRDQLVAKKEDTKVALFSARRQNRKTILALSREIGKREFQISQIDIFLQNVREVDAYKENIKSLEVQIKESLTKQSDVRDDFARRQNQASECFNFTIKSLMNPSDGGKIIIDGNGLRIGIDSETADVGEMYQVQKVICFDLACCIASICGLGIHPRFIIHDSPRAADTEEVAYHQLFHFAADLEKLWKSSLPAFQYIVTTTTPPPNSLENDLYVRIRLHSRNNEGYLLGWNF